MLECGISETGPFRTTVLENRNTHELEKNMQRSGERKSQLFVLKDKMNTIGISSRIVSTFSTKSLDFSVQGLFNARHRNVVGSNLYCK